MEISIVIPVYNVEKYLRRCIESVLAQTYYNTEVILVNDGSTDNCLEICRDYVKKDSRILLIDQKNKGLSGARNSGLKIAKGEYICFIDSDDSIDSSMVEDFFNVLINNHPDVITSNIFQYKTGNLEYRHIRNKLPYNQLLKQIEIRKHFVEPYYGGYLGIIPSACTKMYKVAFLKDNELLFDESLKRAEDYWFNFYVFENAKTVFSIDKAYYHYYSNEGSIIRTYRENQFEMFLKSREKLLLNNKELNCEINWNQFNTDFANNTNEFILLCIKKENVFKSYKKVRRIFNNEEFRKAERDNSINNLQTRLIKMFLNLKLYLFAYMIYYLWSSKI
ncbi:glycosyltransferase family 2 protein [Ancylomarina sp. YFZ004]